MIYIKSYKPNIYASFVSKAEGEGFEPSVPSRVHTLSKRAP